MKRIWIVLAIACLAQTATAREGFSVSLGLGGGIWSLSDSDLAAQLAKLDPPRGDQGLLTGTLADGLGFRFAMAYNIRGYASVEIGITGHGWNLSDSDALGGSGHVALTAHFHPFELFMPERDFDVSVFLGGGYSIVGGGQAGDNLSRALDGGALECGLAGRWFFTNWFSLGAELRLSVPFFARWTVDWEDGEHYGLDASPQAVFLGILVTTGFHFQAG